MAHYSVSPRYLASREDLNTRTPEHPKPRIPNTRVALLLIALLILLPVFSFPQQGVWDKTFQFAMDAADAASGKSVFQLAKPDIIIEVYKHKVGADMFDIRAVKPGYPVDLLRQQATQIGELTGTPVRGLTVGNAALSRGSNMSFTRATFATDGIIDRQKGVLRVLPLVKAFAGAPEPYAVHGITIMFNGEQATQTVLRNYSSPYVRLQATAQDAPPVVEYRVQLLAQDPKLIDIPDAAQAEQKASPTASTVQQNGVDWGLWVPLIAAAAAAGVLVYFFMLRSSAKPRR